MQKNSSDVVRCDHWQGDIPREMKSLGIRERAVGKVTVYRCPDKMNHCSRLAARVPSAEGNLIFRFDLREFSMRAFDLAQADRLEMLVDAVADAANDKAQVQVLDVARARKVRAESDAFAEVERELSSALNRRLDRLPDRRRSELVEALNRALGRTALDQAMGLQRPFVTLDQVVALREIAEVDPRCRAVAKEFLAAGVEEAKRVASAAVAKVAGDLGLAKRKGEPLALAGREEKEPVGR